MAQSHAAVDRRRARGQPDDGVERLLPARPALRPTCAAHPRRGAAGSATSGPIRPPGRWPPARRARSGCCGRRRCGSPCRPGDSARFLGAIADELAPDGLALTLLRRRRGARRRPRRGDGRRHRLLGDPERPAMQWLRGRGVPVVGVDMPWPDGPAVTIDDRGGARAAAEHLIELGHRRVAGDRRHRDEPRLGTGPPPVAGRQRAGGPGRLAGWRDAWVRGDRAREWSISPRLPRRTATAAGVAGRPRTSRRASA